MPRFFKVKSWKAQLPSTFTTSTAEDLRCRASLQSDDSISHTQRGLHTVEVLVDKLRRKFWQRHIFRKSKPQLLTLTSRDSAVDRTHRFRWAQTESFFIWCFFFTKPHSTPSWSVCSFKRSSSRCRCAAGGMQFLPPAGPPANSLTVCVFMWICVLTVRQAAELRVASECLHQFRPQRSHRRTAGSHMFPRENCVTWLHAWNGLFISWMSD